VTVPAGVHIRFAAVDHDIGHRRMGIRVPIRNDKNIAYLGLRVARIAAGQMLQLRPGCR